MTYTISKKSFAAAFSATAVVNIETAGALKLQMESKDEYQERLKKKITELVEAGDYKEAQNWADTPELQEHLIEKHIKNGELWTAGSLLRKIDKPELHELLIDERCRKHFEEGEWTAAGYLLVKNRKILPEMFYKERMNRVIAEILELRPQILNIEYPGINKSIAKQNAVKAGYKSEKILKEGEKSDLVEYGKRKSALEEMDSKEILQIFLHSWTKDDKTSREFMGWYRDQVLPLVFGVSLKAEEVPAKNAEENGKQSVESKKLITMLVENIWPVDVNAEKSEEMSESEWKLQIKEQHLELDEMIKNEKFTRAANYVTKEMGNVKEKHEEKLSKAFGDGSEKKKNDCQEELDGDLQCWRSSMPWLRKKIIALATKKAEETCAAKVIAKLQLRLQILDFKFPVKTRTTQAQKIEDLKARCVDSEAYTKQHKLSVPVQTHLLNDITEKRSQFNEELEDLSISELQERLKKEETKQAIKKLNQGESLEAYKELGCLRKIEQLNEEIKKLEDTEREFKVKIEEEKEKKKEAESKISALHPLDLERQLAKNLFERQKKVIRFLLKRSIEQQKSQDDENMEPWNRRYDPDVNWAINTLKSIELSGDSSREELLQLLVERLGGSVSYFIPCSHGTGVYCDMGLWDLLSGFHGNDDDLEMKLSKLE